MASAAHKWRDRHLLDALARSARGTVPLLIDTDGVVLEAAYANVWVVEGGALLTPPANGRILPGDTRATLLARRTPRPRGANRVRAPRGAESIFVTSSISVRRPARLRRQVLVPVPVAALL